VTPHRSLRGRLRALERRATERGACGVCGGGGRVRVRWTQGRQWTRAGRRDDPEPEGCPGCGKISWITVNTGPAAPRRASDTLLP
jgi:hypothetical protein